MTAPKRLQAMHIDKPDGRIDHSFYVQISEQWRLKEDKLQREIAQHQAADRSYLDEGVQLIELAHGAPRLFRRQEPREQRRLCAFELGMGERRANGEAVPTV